VPQRSGILLKLRVMEIEVNGQQQRVPPEATAADLITLLGLAGQRLAMEINAEIVPRSGYAARRLNDGDRIEIVRAIGGG